MLSRELAERKARFAQELSAAQMERDDHRKVAEEAINRAENAEAVQRSMQVGYLSIYLDYLLLSYFCFYLILFVYYSW